MQQDSEMVESTADVTLLLASSVHDMKNSVSMLIGGLQKVLESVNPETFPAFGDLMQMTYEAKRINSNLVQLLTLYKIGQQIYPFDPQRLCVLEFLQGIAEQTNGQFRAEMISLSIDCDPELYWYFDEDLITGVIGNAFSNAIRYTRDQMRLSARQDGRFLELRIEDNGTGYSPAMLEQSRDSMHSVDFCCGSTGLGLHFSAAVARLHRNRGQVGTITLENGGTLGGGCFVLRLP